MASVRTTSSICPATRCVPSVTTSNGSTKLPPALATTICTRTSSPKATASRFQYWFYWPYNDWNNTHESDWEMIQIVFATETIEQALTVEPVEVGFAQHTGAEQADWVSEKLQRDGDHPIVYPGPGSHATYFSKNLFLGYSASTGFGCDDTRTR